MLFSKDEEGSKDEQPDQKETDNFNKRWGLFQIAFACAEGVPSELSLTYNMPVEDVFVLQAYKLDKHLRDKEN